MTINSPRRELLLPGTFMARPKSTSRYLNQIKINQSINQLRNLIVLSGKGQSGMSSNNKLYFMTTKCFFLMLHLTLTSAAYFEDKWYNTHLMSDPEGNS